MSKLNTYSEVEAAQYSKGFAKEESKDSTDTEKEIRKMRKEIIKQQQGREFIYSSTHYLDLEGKPRHMSFVEPLNKRIEPKSEFI